MKKCKSIYNYARIKNNDKLMKQIIIHIVNENYIQSESYIGDSNIMKDFSEEYSINNIFFYKSEKEPPILLNAPNIEVHNYATEEELIEKVKTINENNKIVCITSYFDNLIYLSNKLKKVIGQTLSDYPEMYNDKSIQRELLLKNDAFVSVKFVKTTFDKLNFEEIEEKIWLPFVLKPTSAAASMWVVKIKTKKNFLKYIENYNDFKERIIKSWYKDSWIIIAEEYINWDFFSVDYFVNDDWEIHLSRPINVTLGTDIDVNDFFNLARLATNDVEKKYKYEDLYEFIRRNVKATWIKNTFIHHEFKINKKGIYKTIEINWRIWWRRIPMYYNAYGVNLFELLFKKEIDFKLNTNIVFIRVYSCKKWIFKWFNEKYKEEIEELKSFSKLNIKEEYINSEIGLTKDWYNYVAVIQLKNDDNKQINKDLEYITENYCDLLNIK